VQAGGAQFGVPECVADAQGRDEVLRVAGIAHERPARAKRLAHEAGEGLAYEPCLTGGGVEPGGKVGDELERRDEVALDVLPVRRELRPRPTGDHHRQIVVRGPGCEPSVRPKVDLVRPSMGRLLTYV
jgi:hypothetical protein